MALHRRLNLLQASALNMANMVGSGPFITIPLILGAMGGPQAMIGWVVGLVLAICDGMVWAELSTAMPYSGGSYVYLREAFSRFRFRGLGQIVAFLFIWQFLVSGTAEIASGAIGFRQYYGYLDPQFHGNTTMLAHLLPPLVCVVCLILLYRRIESVGKLAVVLWVGMMATMAVIIFMGLRHFDAANLTPPPGAFTLNRAFYRGLGAAMLVAMYDYLGYYDVCLVAEEVVEPRRTIPRSILFSVVVIAALYMLMNVSMISVVPWRDAMKSEYLASDFMEKVAGRGAAVVVTYMILWTSLASTFALLLGGSRILMAAARDGCFFRVFARLHPTGDFPHLALIVLGVLSAAVSLFALDEVINLLMVVRVLVQFAGQIVALMILRRTGGPIAYRMWLYPLPALIALAGWCYIFLTAGAMYMAIAGAVLVAGLIAGTVWYVVAKPPEPGAVAS
jgi:basic amino acid/polyamine antiporter, APA family